MLRDWLVHIRRNEHASLQTQIREALVSAILDGQLAREEPIPSTRKMAKSLGGFAQHRGAGLSGPAGRWLSRGPRALGLLCRREGAGQRHAAAPAGTQRGAAGEIDWAARLIKDPAAQENISKPLDWQSYAYPFIYGQVDHKLFPLAEWRDCARQALGKKWLGSWTNDTWAHDDPLLVEQIRRRILPRRGIMASDDEILITLGAQNALYLLTSLLVGPDTRVAMEEPGYPDMRNIFRLKTRNVALIPVDEQGLTLHRSAASTPTLSSPRPATSFRPPSPCRWSGAWNC